MSTCRQIVGVTLVRNEDLHLDRVLANARPFCDRMIIADHGSRDGTAALARAWADRDPGIVYERIADPAVSHDLIRPYLNTPTWIFGVDGDEIYDPAGLQRLRQELLAGRHDRFRQLYGNVLHCSALDRTAARARGYLAPPCRSMTKLYNFAALRDWSGPNPERLHGGRIVFNPGYDETCNGRLLDEYDWASSPLRCLHLVFLPRSSLDAPDRVRLNLAEKNDLRGWGRLLHLALARLGREGDSSYKYEKYRRGPEVDVDVSAFFPGAAA